MSDVLVSVVIPVFNQEKYLVRNIGQLTNQTYKNLELIYVNDGSTDSSGEILKKASSEDSRITIIVKKNGGLVDAELAGIDIASGDYIAFVDPDDIVGSNYIENFVNELDRDYDFVAEGFYFSKNNSADELQLEENRTYEADDVKGLRARFLMQSASSLPANSIFHSRWNKLYRAPVVKRASKVFLTCKDITLGEDSIFTYIFLCKAKLIKTKVNCNEYYYVQDHPDSMVHNPNVDNYVSQSRRAFKRLKKLMEDNGDTSDQPYTLFYMLIQGLMNELVATDQEKEFLAVYELLKEDGLFKVTLQKARSREGSLKRKIALCIEAMTFSPSFIWMMMRKYRGFK